jgi:hypothetical protein
MRRVFILTFQLAIYIQLREIKELKVQQNEEAEIRTLEFQPLSVQQHQV